MGRWTGSTGMGTAMPVEVGADAESFATVTARVRPFTGVNPPVPLQVGALDEAFAAITTTVRPFTGVDTPVLGKVGPSAEAFAAVTAPVRLLPTALRLPGRLPTSPPALGAPPRLYWTLRPVPHPAFGTTTPGCRRCRAALLARVPFTGGGGFTCLTPALVLIGILQRCLLAVPQC